MTLERIQAKQTYPFDIFSLHLRAGFLNATPTRKDATNLGDAFIAHTHRQQETFLRWDISEFAGLLLSFCKCSTFWGRHVDFFWGGKLRKSKTPKKIRRVVKAPLKENKNTCSSKFKSKTYFPKTRQVV